MDFKSSMLITILTLLAVLVVASIRYQNLKGGLRSFIWFLCIEFAFQTIAAILAEFGINNLALLHLYSPITLLLLLSFYYAVLKGFVSKKLFIAVGTLVVIGAITNALFTESIKEFNNITLTSRSIVLLILSLSSTIFLLEKEIQNEHGKALTSIHWINSGILVYHASSLLLLYFGKYIMHVLPEAYNVSWGLHALFLLIMYVCFFIGLWKSPRL